MAEEGKEVVSYEMLQDLLRAERRSNKLMPVPARFWHQVREFLQNVVEAFRVEQAHDPFSRKVMMLSDQAKNAKAAAEALWALRERKMAMLALAGSKDRKAPDGLTADEAILFGRLGDTLDEARLRTFEGTFPIPPPAAPPAELAPARQPPAAIQVPTGPTALPTPTSVATSPAAPAEAPTAMPRSPAAVVSPSPAAPRPAPAPPPAPVVVPSDTRGATDDLVTIRALGDIPPFVGPDMQTYLLKSGDMATVPPAIATLLVRRNKAVLVQT